LNDVNETKAQAIRRMFAQIAPRYDLLNSVLSANLHQYWRTVAVREARLRPGHWVVDVATGTGDFALALARAVGPTGQVVGVDFCEPMVALGREKTRQRGAAATIVFVLGEAEALPLPDGVFECATIGFALRNVTSVEQTLREMARVVKPGGRVVSLELTRPRWPGLQGLYALYSAHLIPRLGGWLSGQPQAYTYLPASIARFISPTELGGMLVKVGLEPVRERSLAGGIATVHVGLKPERRR